MPLPTPTETGLACPAPWAFPPSLCVLEPRATKLRVLAIAEAGGTVTADHLLQMASLAAEHKPTVLGIPGQVPIPYQLECTVVLSQSLHALFQLLTSGNTMQYCPQAASFAVALGTAARQDNGHIVSMAASLALALRAGRSTLAVGLVWDQKGQTHSTLNTHMENVDLLISEEAQQDMDLKSAFAPTVPRQPFFRLLLGDPKQSPGGVADGQRAHRTLLLKAPIGLRAPTTWYMPHEIPGVFHMLLRHGRGFGLSDLEETAKVVGHRPLGVAGFARRRSKPRPLSLASYSDLTILACPLNMQGMPGALQVLAALLHGVQTIYTYDSNKEPNIFGSLDLRATQVAQATTFFQHALLPHPMWLGPLPVCLAEHHHGKVRRLRLVLATITHLTKAEVTSLVEGPYLPGGTVLHNLVYGYAADASLEPEWLVITDGQQPGHWRLLHNSSGPGQRCSVGSSLRYQPTPSAHEQRSAQDYTFEALHRVYFYDAWRVQPVLDAPESDLVLPPKPGLLEHGCYWPRPNLTPEVLSISDRDPDKEEQEVQEGESPTSLAVTDAAMAEENASEAVSIHSSSSESPTIPSTEHPEEDDAHMADDASASTSSAEEEGDCLSNRPAFPDACPARDEMLEAEDPSSSPTLQSSESPIKRRPGSKASAGRAQSKKLRKSLAPPSRQPLGSIPEHEQPPATLADLASQNTQNPVAPACRNPTTPPDRPGSAQERPHAMTEIDIASDQENAERGGTADTDLQLESEQRAMQALYDYQNAARTARETARQRAPLPALQTYSDLPREWPMARLAISSKQINRLVRTFLWRRVTEQALRGSSFVNIPDEINQAYIGDLLRISEAFAAPLSNLFAFVKSGHPACPFITHKQLALYANPRFWQYGLLAFIARCCSFDNQHRHQGPETAQVEEGKSQTTKEKDVDALTFMRTVIMSFVRGMEHGGQTLPTNDLFVYLPVQILPDLVVAMERQGFTPAEVKGRYGYRPKEEDAEDNPLLVVGVHTKDIVYDRYPRMPDTSWAERAYFSGALDPSLGQAFSFPSLLQLRLRIEVPLWRDLTTAKHPTADLSAEEDSASDATGSAERSPKLALPVPVGLAEPPEVGTEEATEDEDTTAEPHYAFAKGYGRFGIGYTRLATALGNFEQGSIEAESAVVAQWLTSGLRVAMARTGWHLLSPRLMLTKVPGGVLSDYYHNGYPFTPKMADRPYNQYGTHLYTEERWDQLCAWLTGNPNFRFQLADHKQALRDHMGYSQEAPDPSNKARRTVPPPGSGSSSSAAWSSWHSRPSPSPSPYGWSYGWWQ